MKLYCDINYVYAVREILPGKWYIQVYWRNSNGRRGGICRLFDELDGPRCCEKVYDRYKLAQASLDKLAKLNGWDVYEE